MGLSVVSLVPSATETLLDWGVTPIAVTRFCEQPHLPTVGGTKNPDVGSIVSMAPDLVVMCPEENRLVDAEELRAAGVPIHAVRIDDVAGVAPALARLATALEIGPPTARATAAASRAASARVHPHLASTLDDDR